MLALVLPMLGSVHLILVIDRSAERAESLKELIEFMDVPDVSTATPGNWLAQAGEHRIAAIFVNEELPEPDISTLLNAIGKFDPNVPIVMVNGESNA